MSASGRQSSFSSLQRNQGSRIAERASLQGLRHHRPEKKSEGSPGSALFSEQTWNGIVERLRLSHREGEIVRRVFDDETEFAIAAELGISPHTVHTHFERLHHKLGVTDRVQLVLSIMQEGLRPNGPSNGPPPPLATQHPAGRV
jgi:DNA-binding CsgD family transcriptional regulator